MNGDPPHRAFRYFDAIISARNRLIEGIDDGYHDSGVRCLFLEILDGFIDYLIKIIVPGYQIIADEDIRSGVIIDTDEIQFGKRQPLYVSYFAIHDFLGFGLSLRSGICRPTDRDRKLQICLKIQVYRTGKYTRLKGLRLLGQIQAHTGRQ